MNLLLDTHVWLWSLTEPERIRKGVLDALSDPANRLFLSAASSWEIAIKYRLGKLPLPEPPSRFIPLRMVRDGIISLAVQHEHAQAVAELPGHHNDPFDRLLLAQSALESLTLVTQDNQFKTYQADIIWA